ncbi:MAG: hypothetical protein ACI8RO_001208 [Flavobacteriales bacterium]|jgi:hypothetical protein
MTIIKIKQTVQKFTSIALFGVCFAYGSNSYADPISDALSDYMECIQQNISLTPDAETAVLRKNCQEAYDVLNTLFPVEIASMIIEQAELDARQ